MQSRPRLKFTISELESGSVCFDIFKFILDADPDSQRTMVVHRRGLSLLKVVVSDHNVKLGFYSFSGGVLISACVEDRGESVTRWLPCRVKHRSTTVDIHPVRTTIGLVIPLREFFLFFGVCQSVGDMRRRLDI